MKKTSLILVHYAEIGLKGRNRPLFEKRLVGNICSRLRAYEGLRVARRFGRMVIQFPEAVPFEPVSQALRQVFGIAYFAPVVQTELEMGAIGQGVLKAVDGLEFKTFAVRTRRVNREFPIPSMTVSADMGGVVLDKHDVKVDLEHPDITVQVEIVNEGAYIFAQRVEGLRGLPVGCSAHVLSLVSGGFDSPVATLRALRRGCSAAILHFHSAPFTSEQSQEKVDEFAEMLVDYQRPVHVYHVALAPIQKEIVAHAPSEFRILLYRRYMLRIAERIAIKEKARALITGEAIGQVSSQTIENMVAVSEVTNMQILRPLVGWDKDEIIAEARTFGTFDISTDPGEDCCSFMSTRRPATRARGRDLARAEKDLMKKVDLNALVDTAIAEATFQIFR